MMIAERSVFTLVFVDIIGAACEYDVTYRFNCILYEDGEY